MRITLKIRSYCSSPPSDPQIRVFDSLPVIVGRSSACDYILKDTTRYISSNHAVVLLEDHKILIQDTSANGLYINGDSEPIGRGHSLELKHEDTLAIGDYTLQVAIENTSQSTPASELNDDPFGDFPANPSSQAVPPSFDPFRGEEPDWTPAASKTADPFADDWDFNEQPRSGHERASATTESDWADWPADNAKSEQPTATRTPSTPQEPAAFSASNDDFDWLPASNAETGSSQSPLSGGGRSAGSSRQTPPSSHQVSRSRASPAQRPSNSRSTNSSVASSDALQAFFKAASLNGSDFEHRNSAEVLEQTGKLLAQMTDAMMVLLQSRMELKNAIRSDTTALSRSGNNPLKFSYGAADALTKLLANSNDGYQQSEHAIQEAVEDLKLHQLAMLEGMKSAVRSLLSEFDPDKLADTLGKNGGISANIPITREAKLWELFCNQYDTIYEEAVSDFGDLFGAEFRKAYDKSIKKAGRKPDF